MRLGRETTAARRKASRLAGLAGRCPAPHTAPIGRGAIRTTCSLAGVLPPWHDGCHGSPVRCGILSVGRYKPPPHGLRYSTPRRVLVGKQLICGVTAARQRASWLAQGVVPLDPGLRAFGAQGHRETRGLASFYRRSATGLAARESGVVSLSVKAKRPPFGNRPHGSQPKSSLFPKQAGLFRYKTAQAMPKPLTLRYFCPAPTQAAAEQSGDRQRREKDPLILTAEKGEHRSAHERWYSLANDNARDVASPADKMGNQGLFPVVAVPLAFFCTLFFRHRKKSVSAP